MAERPVDIAAAVYQAWNEGGIPAVCERFWHPKIEWRDDPASPDAGAHYGRGRVRRHIEERVDVLGEFHIDVERLVERPDGTVLAVFVFRGKGGQSAAPYELRIGQLLTIEEGLVTVVQDVLDPQRALAEADLGRAGADPSS
jgi:ketosteroid isomerase-like protein